ncbi:MAG: outer membrane protein [Shewanella sp.]|uniref:Periplasmic chaperone for outer membrane proteins Skp n=2 Tax=Shewanellaceae TaxID=267890 RepID=A0A4V2RSW1_9GAMM|nr:MULTISPECIES: OmpH family outer membrane protein [Shewanella]MCL2906545.1 OmpH family outer membrane protein [Shewanella fodinae]MDN5368855.1 outer membrane protein [Shewanella sp.]TCN88006.1 periplasmic chaperone for outer membrane proteins Skp [Shewanella fodinae]GGZ02137.1 molecular chaperone Skp [Shewanella fodinae]
MKKLMNGALVSLMLVGAPMAAYAEKLAVVDMGAVFEQIPQREQVTKQLKSEFGDRMAEVQKLQDELKGLLEKQQRDAQLMTDAQKTDLVRKMESLKADYQLKGKALDEDLRRRQGEEQNKLLVKVQKAINDIAKKENYDMVLQRGAVIYVKPEQDISSKVVDALSKGQ